MVGYDIKMDRKEMHLRMRSGFIKFYAYRSVHRETILKKFQRDDTLYSILLFPVSRSSTTTAGQTLLNTRCCEYSLI
jgi:hypothetical protein